MAVAGDLALNVAASLVFEGLKRPFQALQFEMKRRTEVSRALNERAPTRAVRAEDDLKDAIQAMARIIGNSEGKLDQNTAKFLRELQRSAVPETIAHIALCGRHTDSVFPAFDSIYNLFTDLPFSSKALFNGLFECIRERVERVEDPALLKIVRAQNHALSTQLDHIILALNNSCSVRFDTPEDIEEARVRVAKAVEAANRFCNVETLQGSKKFRLKTLAIPSRLSDIDAASIQAAKFTEQNDTLGYINFRRQFHRAVILGDPGGGKSTLTQMLCIDLANSISLESTKPGLSHFDQRDLRLPLRIILRSYESRHDKNPAYSFFDYLRDEITPALDNDTDLAAAFLRRTLALGEAAVIFDGLDEVLDIGSRSNMVTYIEQFAEIYSACPMLVTSRLVGYRDAPLSEDFHPYGLAQFNSGEVLKYAEGAIRAVGVVKAAEAKERAAQFVRQTDSIGGDIRTNPLMLGLMVQIYVFRGDVPSNRPEIYKECALLMFEKWDGKRKIIAPIPREDFELLDIFSFVAGQIFGSPEREEGVNKEWLTHKLRENFEGWYIDKANAHRAAKALVEFLTGRAWVMSEVGHHAYKFTHRTFLEYFFARGLISETSGVAELIRSKLLDRVMRNEWDVIAHLSLQMAVFRDGGRMRQAAAVIQELLDEAAPPAMQEIALLSFISKSMEYLTVPEALFSNTIEKLLNRLVSVGSRESVTAAGILRLILSSARTRLPLALASIDRVVDGRMSGSAPMEKIFCMYLLDLPSNGPRHSSGDLAGRRAKTDRHWISLTDLRSKYKHSFYELALEDHIAAKTFIASYGDNLTNLYEKHGVNIITSSQSDLVPFSSERTLVGTLASIMENFGRPVEIRADVSKITNDRLSFVNSIVEDAQNGTFKKLEAPLVSNRHLRFMENELDKIMRQIWTLHSRKSHTKNREDISKVFLCIMMLTEAFPDVDLDPNERSFIRYGDEGSSHHHPIVRIAPISIVNELDDNFSDLPLSPVIHSWIDGKVRFLR